MKQVPHGHTNLGKGTKVEAQTGEQVEENMFQTDHMRKPSTNAGFGII